MFPYQKQLEKLLFMILSLPEKIIASPNVFNFSCINTWPCFTLRYNLI